MSTTYPDQYLLVTNRIDSSYRHIVEIADNEPLDLEALLRKWGDRHLDEGGFVFDISRPIRGLFEWQASIITDGRPPDTCIVWESAEFDVHWT
jgi:hypothetical protein